MFPTGSPDAMAGGPFLAREQAFQMLGHGDLGGYKGLTARLGMRADMEYGWEEFLPKITSAQAQPHVSSINLPVTYCDSDINCTYLTIIPLK